MSYLFEYVYNKYKKEVIKSETIKSIRFLLIPYSLFFLFLMIASKCPFEIVYYPISVCIISLLLFFIFFFCFRHKGHPTEIAEELNRSDKLRLFLEHFSYQDERFNPDSRNNRDLSKPVEIDCLLSDCDCYLANKIDVAEVFAIVIPLMNCFISGDSIQTWIESLSELSHTELIYITILAAISAIIVIIMVYMVISSIKNMQTLCFPTKKTIVISMRRDLLRLKMEPTNNSDNNPSNYNTAKE